MRPSLAPNGANLDRHCSRVNLPSQSPSPIVRLRQHGLQDERRNRARIKEGGGVRQPR